MSPSDTQKLHEFLAQLVQARGVQKDPEADALIRRAVEQQPDAAYLLVQRALLMEQALDAARSRIAMLESQLHNEQRSGGSFLDPATWGNRHRAHHTSHPSYQQPHHMSWQHAFPGFSNRSGGFLGGGGGGGLLGSIAATAAGVAAGSFLFHGLDNIFHDHDHGGGASHLLSDNDQGAGAFADQSGSALADQAGINDIGQSEGLPGDEGGLDGNGGFFDGDGSDEGLFS